MEILAYAERAVDLVNTEIPGADQDSLRSEQDLRRLLPATWTVSHKAAEDGLRELRAVRPRLRRIFEQAAAGHGRSAVQAVNKLLVDFPASLSISDHDDDGWHMHLADAESGPARRFVTGAALGLAYTIAERGPERLGVCEATRCRAVFVDTTTNSSRRYCSDRCATRANVAAYRARKRAGVGGGARA
ncbi:CGNR zinc finger domain-containing protein [Catenulispora yoronensis]|uniref:CGNR zinc finger domain-containing protein n=1 Tax=Catenulispora yoronensis TaxID=450799 RepID=A0ABN2VJE6_9ACTN